MKIHLKVFKKSAQGLLMKKEKKLFSDSGLGAGAQRIWDGFRNPPGLGWFLLINMVFIINILIFHQAYMLDTAFCQVESKFTAFSNIFKHFYFDFQSPALSTSRSSLTGG